MRLPSRLAAHPLLAPTRAVLLAWIASIGLAFGAETADLCRIAVVDKETGWPIPMVELRTTHNVRFVTDNAGIIAFDLPELMGRETWFSINSPGYEAPQDAFGQRGVRLTPDPGTALEVQLNRTSIAKRLGRLTGAGLMAESEKLGDGADAKEFGVLGCDSVQNAVHRGKMFWAWGDTAIARYPLGIFHASSATTTIKPLESFEPPVQIEFDYFTDARDQPRGVAQMPGSGPTWLHGYVSLPDDTGAERLVATYVKIKPPLEAYERGLCVWNDVTENFERLRAMWTKSDATPKSPQVPSGHPAFIERDGKKWVLFGDPLPVLRCPATFEAWQDPSTWEELRPQEHLLSIDGAEVRPHAGSIAWNEYRQRWVTVFMQTFGKPSAFGEIWYAEADEPTGPWGPAVKILSHENYSFYNPRIHPEFTPEDSPILLFEGTYTQGFADRPHPTPRYDYNQILYRLDLDDPRLAAAQVQSDGGGTSSTNSYARDRNAHPADDGWISLITDDWSMWREPDRRVIWAGDAQLRPGKSNLLVAEPGDSVFLIDRKAQVPALESRQSFGDCELHVEFLIAEGSNSGVKLHGHYELQIFDSYRKAGELHGSDCGGVYPRWQWSDGKFTYLDAGIPPSVNVAKPPGEWQSFDISFRAPRFDAHGKKTENARFEMVKLNGRTIHRNVELKTPTGLVGHAQEAATGPLLIQLDHGPVAFREILIRPISD